MNNNQFTQKTLEALQAAQQLAIEYQHNAFHQLLHGDAGPAFDDPGDLLLGDLAAD